MKTRLFIITVCLLGTLWIILENGRDAHAQEYEELLGGDSFLKIVFIDLGTKGESILVIFPNNSTMLVDGGMPNSYAVLESALKRHGISNIDIMVGTHADQDHIAGLTRILDDPDFEVKSVLISHVPSNTATYKGFLEKTYGKGMEPQTVFSGHVVNVDDSVGVRIISPPKDGILDGPNASLTNSNALVILIEYGDISFLLTSDATRTTEEWLVVEYDDLDIDIMNGPHHGSRYSSTEHFIDKVTPRLVIFSADYDNEYGHPHQEAVDRYASRNISYYQTGIEGDIVIRTDGSRCSLVLADEIEYPCYDGVQTVPEFTLAVLIFAMSTATAFAISNSRAV